MNKFTEEEFEELHSLCNLSLHVKPTEDQITEWLNRFGPRIAAHGITAAGKWFKEQRILLRAALDRESGISMHEAYRRYLVSEDDRLRFATFRMEEAQAWRPNNG